MPQQSYKRMVLSTSRCIKQSIKQNIYTLLVNYQWHNTCVFSRNRKYNAQCLSIY